MTAVIATASDLELIEAVRSGDRAAFGELWQRHAEAAQRYARMIRRNRHDADELLGEASIRILTALLNGGGPTTAFRPYLVTTLRRVSVDLARGSRRLVLMDDNSDVESVAEDGPRPDDTAEHAAADDVVMAKHENKIAWTAWQSLDEDTRILLWHNIVDEQRPAQIALHLGTSANVVSVRLNRAKEKLREAYLQCHVADSDSQHCQWTRSRLGAHVRRALPPASRKCVDDHLKACRDCAAVLLAVRDAAPALRRALPLIVLFPGTGAGGWAVGGAAFWRRPSQSAGVAAAVVGIAAAAGVGAYALTGRTAHEAPVAAPPGAAAPAQPPAGGGAPPAAAQPPAAKPKPAAPKPVAPRPAAPPVAAPAPVPTTPATAPPVSPAAAPSPTPAPPRTAAPRPTMLPTQAAVTTPPGMTKTPPGRTKTPPGATRGRGRPTLPSPAAAGAVSLTVDVRSIRLLSADLTVG